MGRPNIFQSAGLLIPADLADHFVVTEILEVRLKASPVISSGAGTYSRPEAGGGKFDVFGVPSTLINDRTGYKNVCSHVQDDFKSPQSLPRRTSS
jgi:hypothetical protein